MDFIDYDSFIDGASDISEIVCEHFAFQNVKVNIDNALKDIHEKAISDLDKASEFTNFSNADLAEELPEIAIFAARKKS